MKNIDSIITKYGHTVGGTFPSTLDYIMDDITIETASMVSSEYVAIVNTFSVMANIADTLSKESGVDDVDGFVVKELETVGLTKEFFGVTETLTSETASISFVVNNETWKKVWSWILEKLKQLKEWLTRVFDALFNRNKTVFKTIEDLKRITLGERLINSIDNSVLIKFNSFLPDFEKSLMGYVEELMGNNMAFSDAIKNTIKHINSPLGGNKIFVDVISGSGSKVATILGHKVYDIKGHFINVYGDSASYLVADSEYTKILRDSYTITGNAKTSKSTTPLTPVQISKTLLHMSMLAGDLDKGMQDEKKSIHATITILEGKLKETDKEDVVSFLPIVTTLIARQQNLSFNASELEKLIRLIVVHIRCYVSKYDFTKI